VALSSQIPTKSAFPLSRGRGPTVLQGLNNPFHSISAIQEQVDILVSRFIDEASDARTLTALMVGGLAYRVGRVGALRLGEGHLGKIPIQMLSLGTGLGAEVTAFEFANRLLRPQTPQQWSWSGAGGWHQALMNNSLTFGLQKKAGYLSRESNLIFQHAFASTAMVAGHQISALLAITPVPEGGLAERFVQAEVMNIQMRAGTSLVSGLVPGIITTERKTPSSLSDFPNQFLLRNIEPKLALESPTNRQNSLGGIHEPVIFPSMFQMAKRKGPSDGENVKSFTSPLEVIRENQPKPEIRHSLSVKKNKNSFYKRLISAIVGDGSQPGDSEVLEKWRSKIGDFILDLQRRNVGRQYFRVSLLGQLDPKTQEIIRLSEIISPPKMPSRFTLGLNYYLNDNRLEVAMLPSREGLKSYRHWKYLFHSLTGTTPIFSRLTIAPHQEKIDFHLENIIYANRCLKLMTVGAQTLVWSSIIDPTRYDGQYFEPYLSVAKNGYFVGLQYRILERLSQKSTFYEIGLPKLGDLVGIDYASYENKITKERIKIPIGAIWQSPPNKYQNTAVRRWMIKSYEKVTKPEWVRMDAP